MMDISEIQNKFSQLIESRTNTRAVIPQGGSAVRTMGESLLNRFAFQLTSQAALVEQKDAVVDEIVENMVSSLVMANMMGIDLEQELTNLINLLETVSAEAS